jgi:hypothetical protein
MNKRYLELMILIFFGTLFFSIITMQKANDQLKNHIPKSYESITEYINCPLNNTKYFKERK